MSSYSRARRARLPNGAEVWIEVEPVRPPERDVVALEDMSELDTERLSGTLEGIAEVVHRSIAAVKPDKASVELAVEVGLESGNLTALWVKGTGKAHMKVTLTWEPQARSTVE